MYFKTTFYLFFRALPYQVISSESSFQDVSPPRNLIAAAPTGVVRLPTHNYPRPSHTPTDNRNYQTNMGHAPPHLRRERPALPAASCPATFQGTALPSTFHGATTAESVSEHHVFGSLILAAVSELSGTPNTP